MTRKNEQSDRTREWRWSRGGGRVPAARTSGGASAGRRRRVVRLIIGNAVVLGVLLLAVGGVGEIYYRFYYDSTDSFGLTKVCQRWFKRHYAFNTMGVRDNCEYSPVRVAGMRRVSFLGDSFTAGHGVAVEERFANRVRAGLAPGGWEVHVLAANGLDTGEEVQGLMDLVRDGYEPDVVVLVYVLNDVADLVPEWGAILRRIYGEQQREPLLVRHSYFLNLLYYRVKAARDPAIANYYGFVQQAYTGALWETQQQRLHGLHEFCKAQGARLFVVTFPFLHETDDPEAYARIYDQLGAFWEKAGVSHLDLRPTFAGATGGDLAIGRYDAHPNAEAHRLAAEAITAFLQAELR